MSVSNPLHSKHLEVLEAAHKPENLWDVSCVLYYNCTSNYKQDKTTRIWIKGWL